MAFPDSATDDGYDCQMQTNHLSHFLLTKLLFPLLERKAGTAGEARVVNHSSMAAWYPGTRLGERYLGKNGGNLGGLDFVTRDMFWEIVRQSCIACSLIIPFCNL